LNGGGEVDGGGENSSGVAGFDRPGWRSREDAGEAGCGVPRTRDQRRRTWFREDGHGGGVGADGGGVDPGFGLLDGVVVEEVAGFEVVGGVEYEVSGAEKFVDVGGDEVGDVGMDDDGGVEERDLAACGFGFGEGFAGVCFVEEDLALEVGGLDEVAVDEGESADAGAGEEGCGCGSGGSDADDGDVGGCEQLLAGGTDAGEENLAGVAIGVDGGGDRGAA